MEIVPFKGENSDWRRDWLQKEVKQAFKKQITYVADREISLNITRIRYTHVHCGYLLKVNSERCRDWTQNCFIKSNHLLFTCRSAVQTMSCWTFLQHLKYKISETEQVAAYLKPKCAVLESLQGYLTTQVHLLLEAHCSISYAEVLF